MSKGDKTKRSDGKTVEIWYDRQSRNWVTQLNDSEGNQISSEYNGTKAGAMFSRDEFLKEEAPPERELGTSKFKIRLNPMRCDQCASTTVNGVFVHEQGCPVQARQRKCFECGNSFTAAGRFPFQRVCDDCSQTVDIEDSRLADDEHDPIRSTPPVMPKTRKRNPGRARRARAATRNKNGQFVKSSPRRSRKGKTAAKKANRMRKARKGRRASKRLKAGVK